MVTEPPSSSRRSWDSRSSRPAAMRAATCSVGLVSPRSTWESIGAETPERAALIADSAAAAGDPLRSRQWNLSLIESDAAHATSTGEGATVAIVDSGAAASHPDLQG